MSHGKRIIVIIFSISCCMAHRLREKVNWRGYIGNRMQREIISKRVSDVMDCYVGETERGSKYNLERAKYKLYGCYV